MGFVARMVRLCLFVLLAVCATHFVARADYPLISHKYSTDPTALEFNGRLYLYCSNDTDNGTPNLSATNNFIITVNPASQPALSSINLGSQVILSATGMIGPNYSLSTSTNLLNWQFLFTTNPTAMPVTLTDTNRYDAVRFYRLQLGP